MEEFIAIIKLFAGNYAPQGWMLCQGQTLKIAQYNALYSVIGSMYGGDGQTTFNLPDLRGRIPVGIGSGPYLTNHNIGDKFGVETVTIMPPNLPITFTSQKVVISDAGETTNVLVPSYPTPIDIHQPSIGLNYIICIDGCYPSSS